MPSSTQKQARAMAWAAHDPAAAKHLGIPLRVAREFNKADTGTKLLSNAMKKRPTTIAGLSRHNSGR